MEVLLEGSLEAALAHIGVHGVALILVFRPLRGFDEAEISQNMGGVGGGILPDGGGLHRKARCIQLQNGRQILRGDVFQQGIGRQAGEVTAQLQLIPQPHHQAYLPVLPVVGNPVGATELLHKLGGRNVRVPLPIAQEVLKIPLPGGGELGEGVFIGLFQGHRKVLQIGDFPLLQEVDQLPQGFVGMIRIVNHVIVKHQVVAGPIGHQHIAVPVQNFPTGGRDPAPGGIGGLQTAVGIGVPNLQAIHPESKQAQHSDK